VAETAKELQVEPRALAVRTLLHLPRLADVRGHLPRETVAAELQRQGRRLHHDLDAVGRSRFPVLLPPLSSLQFGAVAPSIAELVFSRLHYLRSARPGSLNFGLLHPSAEIPVALCSVTPYDWRKAGSEVRTFLRIKEQDEIWDVSRVYCCDGAPPNAISYLLARVRQNLRSGHLSARILATRVDPNLGFTGASYRADNWQLAARMRRRPYLYLDGWYVSPRQLRDACGTSNVSELQRALPRSVFTQSRVGLLDSMIFCYRLPPPGRGARSRGEGSP
jgi:hypothetical protein